MEEYLKNAYEASQHTCKCQSRGGTTPGCQCWDSNHVFIRLNRSQCQFLILQLMQLRTTLSSVLVPPPVAAQELCRISKLARLLVEECGCTQWLLKALELTVDAEYVLAILREAADVLCDAWSGNLSDVNQELLDQLRGRELEETATSHNLLDRHELERRLKELSDRVEPSNGDITTHGDLARFLQCKLRGVSAATEISPSWHPPELIRFRTNINELEIEESGGRASGEGASREGGSARIRDLKLLGKAYVVKVPLLGPGPTSDFGSEGPCPFKKEAEILEKYRNPYLVRVIGYWTVERTPFIIEERMDLDLQKLIDKVNKLRPLEVIELLLPVAKVMWHLHDRGVAHRDLKPGNIMCTLQQNFSIACSPLQDITIKLIDLGEAAVENVSSFGGWRNVGTTEYKAPELFQEGTGAALDLLKADVFSFGVLLLKVLTRLTVRETGVFRQLGLKDYKNALKAGQRPSISHQVPDCLSRIIESCWAHEPRERPSFDVIYKTLLDSRHQLSTEVHENRKSFKTQWLDTVRNVKMHMSLHSMAHLILCFSRALVAPIVLILFLFFIWSCLRTTMPRQQGAHSLLPKCMNFENPSCAAVLDSLLTS